MDRLKRAWDAYERWAGEPFTARYVAAEAAWRFAANAAFPHLCHRARWPTRLGPRATAAYVVAMGGLGLVVRGLPLLAQRRTEAVAALREELGREPTEEEIAARLGLDG